VKIEKGQSNNITTILITILILAYIVWVIVKSVAGLGGGKEQFMASLKTEDAKVVGELVKSNLVSWWKFDGDVKDIVRGNHAVIMGAGNDSHTEDNVLVLDGIDDCLVVPTTGFDKKRGTCSLWIKPDFDSTINSDIYIGGMRYDSANQLLFVYSHLKDSFYIGYPGGQAYAPKSVFSAGEWIHLVFTWDFGVSGGGARAYCNGVGGTANPQSGVLTGMASQWVIGQNPGGGGFFKGSVDNTMVFNKALSGEQIGVIYNSQKK